MFLTPNKPDGYFGAKKRREEKEDEEKKVKPLSHWMLRLRELGLGGIKTSEV